MYFSSYTALQEFYKEQNINFKPFNKSLKKKEKDYSMIKSSKLNMLSALSVFIYAFIVSVCFAVIFSFIPNDEMEKLYQQASLIVTHAGAGSILQGVKNHKKIIAVPRLKKYQEHVNDHQIELATKLEQLGCILTYQDGEDFISLYEKAKTFNPLPFNQKGNIEGLIDQSLEKYLK